jgi:MarR family transcriptional regulator, organic hydroperoxide resistance regulator
METGTETLEPGPAAADSWALLRSLFGLQRRRFLIAASELDLHPAQAGALLQLAAPLPMNELAYRLACDNSNVTGLIDRLEARGLVVRRPSFDDRRVKHVVLTDAGRELRERMLEQVARPTPGFERLTEGEQRQLARMLRRILNEDAGDGLT